MMKFLQSLCLAAYRTTAATGVFETKLGEKVFLAAYEAYKELIEATLPDQLVQWVAPGDTVIDVGANVGFFTSRFARWVGPGGRVIAIEPEAKNISRLRARMEREQPQGAVEIIEGVAAEARGTLHLVLNPHHPADHKIGVLGVPVQAWPIDELLRARGWPKVSFIKIDVQGAEMRVLRGARETIERWRPTLLVEIDGPALQAAGSSADELFDELTRAGYKPYHPSSPHDALTPEQTFRSRRSLAYGDVLFHC